MEKAHTRVLPTGITVYKSPLPFSNINQKAVVPQGASIADIVGNLGDNLTAHVSVGGVPVPPEMWQRVKPKQGTLVNVRVVPQGGGGNKSVLGTLLTLAVVIAAPYAGAALAAGVGVTSTAGIAAFTGLAGVVGSLAVRAIAPPSTPKLNSPTTDSPTLFIQGARNEMRPFGVIPMVLGRHKMVPPLGARTITETVGDDQYVRQLFCWGYGNLELTNFKIGDTNLESFQDVELETSYNTGAAPDLNLYQNVASQNDLSVTLDTSFVERTTPEDVDEVSVDITFPQGLVTFLNNGSKANTTVTVQVQISPTGAGTWSAPADAYEAVSAQSLAVPYTPATPPVTGNTGQPYYRTDAVVIDQYSGTAKIIYGTRTSHEVPAPPPTPQGYYRIGSVTTSNSGTRTVANYRSQFIGKEFENDGDFEVTNGATIGIAAGGLKFLGFRVTARQTNAVRKTIRFPVSTGQYDVRLKRLTAESASSNVTDAVVWTALRTFKKASPITKKGICATAVRMRATDQLNGAIDTFSAECSQVIPDWNGSSWVDGVTSNPASIVRFIYLNSSEYTGILGPNENPLAEADIDMDKLQEWHDFCAAQGYEFNAVIDFETSVDSLVRDVCAAGRASPTIVDGKRSVVIDNARTQVVQHITPRNSWGYGLEKSFPDQPHAFRVQFVNAEADYIQDEIVVYDDGYTEANATKFERLELYGVTTSSQAYKLAREHIATVRLRPETHVFNMDIEHLVATRGDLVRFTHDVPLVGLGFGRVTAITDNGTEITAVTLDEQVTMQSGNTYNARFRLADGETLVTPITNSLSTTSTLTLATPVAIADGPAVGDLCMFGTTASESIPLVIKSIEPRGDLTAEIHAVDYAPEIFDASTGIIPDYNPNISVPVELQRPVPPVIKLVQTNETVQELQLDGSVSTRMVLTLENNNTFPVAVNVQLREVGETSYQQADIISATPNRVVIGNLQNGSTYDVRIYYRNVLNGSTMVSAPATENGVFFVGTTGNPADVQNLDITVRGENVYLSWDANTDIDLAGYDVRFSKLTSGATWESALPLAPSPPKGATGASYPSAKGTYLVKARDRDGNTSENAATAVTTIADIAGLNFILEVDESAAWGGTFNNTVIDSGSLRLEATTTVDDWASIDALPSIDIGDGGLAVSGTYEFADVEDLGEVLTSVLSADIAISGANMLDNIDSWESIDQRISIDGLESASYGAEIQVATTNDDPSGSPVWSPWRKFVIGEYTARAFKFRIALSSSDSNVTPLVSTLKIQVDVPDRVESDNDIVISAGGATVTYPSEFRAVPSIGIAVDNLAVGDRYEITNKTKAGFDIEFFDNTGTSIGRTFSYVAKGYGKILT